jgi:hypothetical protein
MTSSMGLSRNLDFYLSHSLACDIQIVADSHISMQQQSWVAVHTVWTDNTT